MSFAPPAHPKRRLALRHTLRIGQRFVRKSDGSEWSVRQIHRADREVELLPTWLQPPASNGVVHRVSFRDLRRRFERVEP